MSKETYFVDGKAYNLATSTMLCVKKDAFNCTETLYRTENGAYFTITDEILAMPKVQVLSKDAAKAFLNENTAGIDKANYIALFGKPEQA